MDRIEDFQCQFNVTSTTAGFPDEDLLLDTLIDAMIPRVPELSNLYIGERSGLSQRDDGTATLTVHCTIEPGETPLDTVTIALRDALNHDVDLVADSRLVATDATFDIGE